MTAKHQPAEAERRRAQEVPHLTTFAELGFTQPQNGLGENTYLKAIGYSDADIEKLVQSIKLF